VSRTAQCNWIACSGHAYLFRGHSEGGAMPLQEHHQIVSVDDHLIGHPRVWRDRLPAKFVDRGPNIIEDERNRHVGL
jgi:hypothetical protein